jgi:hypothetical protein
LLERDTLVLKPLKPEARLKLDADKENRMGSEMGMQVKRWNVVEVTTEERCRGYNGGIIHTRSRND